MSPTTENLISQRCYWCSKDELYTNYHDNEWAKPVHDDVRLFEKIALESFQAGLSWYTILKKREHFRTAFAQFDIQKITLFGVDDVARLLQNQGIIRHRGKIEATINNAQRAIELTAEFGSLDAYFWQYQPSATERPNSFTRQTIPVSTETSVRMSKDLKKRGWKFVGPTTCYAFMQAVGLVNDHLEGCLYR